MTSPIMAPPHSYGGRGPICLKDYWQFFFDKFKDYWQLAVLKLLKDISLSHMTTHKGRDNLQCLQPLKSINLHINSSQPQLKWKNINFLRNVCLNKWGNFFSKLTKKKTEIILFIFQVKWNFLEKCKIERIPIS